MHRQAAIILGLVMSISSAAHAGLVGGAADGTIFDIDPDTGLASNLRQSGLSTFRGLAFDAEGTLLGTAFDSLYRLNIDTGVPQLIGTQGFRTIVRDFALDPLSDLLLTSGNVGREGQAFPALFTVDPTTASVQVIAETEIAGSIAFESVGRFVLLDTFQDTLFLVDIADGQIISSVGVDHNFNNPGLVFDDQGTLYVLDGQTDSVNALYTLSPLTGVVNLVGKTGTSTDLNSLAFIPEPATLFLLGMGSLEIAHRRRRHQP